MSSVGKIKLKTAAIPNYSLYGENDHWQMPEPVHCERIIERSSLHNWEIRPHRHDALLQILFLDKGAATAILDGVRYVVEDPCIVLVSPMTVHGFRFTEDADGVVVTLDQSALDQILSPAPAYAQELQTSFVLQNIDIADEAAGFRFSFAELLREYVASRRGRLLALNACLSLILVRILRLRTANSSERVSVRSQKEDLAGEFKVLVDNHFREHRDVSFYAQALCISKSKLLAVTRFVFSSAPSHVLHSRLLLEARRNLAYTNLSIAEVSYLLGFQDPAYFSRFFKKRSGETPAHYRRRVLKRDETKSSASSC
jgi:AraC family transcriptional activator of pobA